MMSNNPFGYPGKCGCVMCTARRERQSRNIGEPTVRKDFWDSWCGAHYDPDELSNLDACARYALLDKEDA